jgi:hypothetical protein
LAITISVSPPSLILHGTDHKIQFCALQPAVYGALKFPSVVVVTTNSFGKSIRLKTVVFEELTAGSEIFREFVTAEIHFMLYRCRETVNLFLLYITGGWKGGSHNCK